MDMPALSLGALTSPAESVFDTISNDIPKNREKTFEFGAGFTIDVLDRNENASQDMMWRARHFSGNNNRVPGTAKVGMGARIEECGVQYS